MTCGGLNPAKFPLRVERYSAGAAVRKTAEWPWYMASERSGEETGDLLRGTGYASERVLVIGASCRPGVDRSPAFTLRAYLAPRLLTCPVLQSFGFIHAHYTP